VLAALDCESGKPLYLSFIGNEKTSDYVDAVVSIKARGYTIKSIVLDGKKSVSKL